MNKSVTVGLYLLILFIFSKLQISAQNYNTFPNSNAFWSERSTYNDGTGITENIYTLFINGDTIVNGLNYHKLYKTGIENIYTPSWVFINSSTYNNIFTAMFREDSLKHIYINNLGNETLLYDFNLQLNDTLDYLGYQYILAQGTYVSAIDSVIVGAAYRKRYYLTANNLASNYITLVEGIGSSFGLLYFTAPLIEQSGNLFCFKSDSGIYILDSLNCSFLGINDSEDIYSLNLFPNPSHNNLYIVQSHQDQIKSISIFNSIGQKQIVNYSSIKNGESMEVNVSSLSPGIYFLEMMSDKYNIVKKFIKE